MTYLVVGWKQTDLATETHPFYMGLMKVNYL